MADSDRTTVADLDRETVLRFPNHKTSNQMVHLTDECRHVKKGRRNAKPTDVDTLFHDSPVCVYCLEIEGLS